MIFITYSSSSEATHLLNSDFWSLPMDLLWIIWILSWSKLLKTSKKSSSIFNLSRNSILIFFGFPIFFQFGVKGSVLTSNRESFKQKSRLMTSLIALPSITSQRELVAVYGSSALTRDLLTSLMVKRDSDVMTSSSILAHYN